MANEILDNYLDIEQRKLLTLIDKRGVNINVYPVHTKDSNYNEVDILNQELKVDIIGEKQEIKHQYIYDFDNPIETKGYFVKKDYEFNILSDIEVENGVNNNIINDNEIYINYDKILEVGTLIEIVDYDIKYKISEIMKNRNLTKIYKYKINRA